jgi:hypothetical protein
MQVLLKGRLRGLGREAHCDVLARRWPADKDGKEGYSEVRIVEGPSGEFPDGDYVLHVGTRTLSVQRRGGKWLLGLELLTEHKLSHPPIATAS